MGAYLAALMRANRLVDAAYAEPFAGGAGAGLYLLFRGYASRLYLNDIDRRVISFWRAVLSRNEEFARRIERVPLTVPEWDRQKETFATAPMGMDLGFAFFYLNRTNRSGIMNGGIIGGRKQTGEWRIDARFSRRNLAARVRALLPFRRQIRVTRLDALDFLEGLPAGKEKVLTYLDPPYYQKGQDLYTNFYQKQDHHEIAHRLGEYRNPWLMTYDACDEIRALYKNRVVLDSELSYSARKVRRGKELVIFGPGVKRPQRREDLSTRRRRGFEIM